MGLSILLPIDMSKNYRMVANSAVPDQTQQNLAFDQGLQFAQACLSQYVGY